MVGLISVSQDGGVWLRTCVVGTPHDICVAKSLARRGVVWAPLCDFS